MAIDASMSHRPMDLVQETPPRSHTSSSRAGLPCGSAGEGHGGRWWRSAARLSPDVESALILIEARVLTTAARPHVSDVEVRTRWLAAPRGCSSRQGSSGSMARTRRRPMSRSWRCWVLVSGSKIRRRTSATWLGAVVVTLAHPVSVRIARRRPVPAGRRLVPVHRVPRRAGRRCQLPRVVVPSGPGSPPAARMVSRPR